MITVDNRRGPEIYVGMRAGVELALLFYFLINRAPLQELDSTTKSKIYRMPQIPAIERTTDESSETTETDSIPEYKTLCKHSNLCLIAKPQPIKTNPAYIEVMSNW